jgi:3',5'-cyclic AMP phosphodiesterase CpdA
MSIKIGIMADNQGSDQPDNPAWKFLPTDTPEYRRYTTAATRLGDAVATFNEQNVDIVVDLGDLIDQQVSEAQEILYLRARLLQYADLTMPFIGTPGNHEKTIYTTPQEVIDYYTEIDTIHETRANVFTDVDDFESYTYDFGGIRFIVPRTDIGYTEDATLTWFEAQLASSPLPVIVCAHVPIWKNNDISAWGYVWRDYELWQAKIDASDNVQAVFCGHWHQDNADVVINNVPYYGFFGSVLCPNADDNAYFILEIKPNALYTPNGRKANIKITGYGNNGVPKTTDFKQYGVV